MPVPDDNVPDATNDMPPLVDASAGPMTYTFFADMTPFSPADRRPDEPSAHSTALLHDSAPSAKPALDDYLELNEHPVVLRGAHGKKRDASYIPRPPNAFILFRSSFIRSQQVTGKVEGNHSNLSKIIGMYWKSLSKEERAKWEAKAVIAQAEHRKRYPDWRFRPGANTFVKQKINDVTGTSNRRRKGRVKDPPAKGEQGDEDEPDPAAGSSKGKGKGKGRARARTRRERPANDDPENSRFVKIANLLVEGKKGVELEAAVEEWEDRRRKGKMVRLGSDADDDAVDRSPIRSPSIRTPDTAESTSSFSALSDSFASDSGDRRSRSRSPARPGQPPLSSATFILDREPLTHMFKRSSSAPAPCHRFPYLTPRAPLPSSPLRESATSAERSPTPVASGTAGPSASQSQTHTHGHARRETISFPIDPSSSSSSSSQQPAPLAALTWEEEETRRRLETAAEPSLYFVGGTYVYDHGCDETYEPGSAMSLDSMGYEGPGALAFDREYFTHFSNDGTEAPGHGNVNWTNVQGRSGLVAVIDDPLRYKYTSSSVPVSPSIPENSPASPLHQDGSEPGLSSPTFYSPSSPVPSSSFSTLSGWNGETKLDISLPSLLDVRVPTVHGNGRPSLSIAKFNSTDQDAAKEARRRKSGTSVAAHAPPPWASVQPVVGPSYPRRDFGLPYDDDEGG